MKRETIFEIAYLLIIVGVFLWLGLGAVWNHEIEHSKPWGYFAGDAFQHQIRATSIQDNGNYHFEPEYMTFGYKDVRGNYPPLLNHIAVQLSNLTGLKVFDTILFSVFFLASLAIIAMYFIIKHFDSRVAILAMPLSIFLLTARGSWIGFFFGHWPAVVGNVFLVLTIWALLRIENKNGWILLGIALAGTALGHTSEAIFAVLLIMAVVIFQFVKKQMSKELFFKYARAAALFFVLSIFYILIFKQSWMATQPFTFIVQTEWEGGGGVLNFKDFGWTAFVMAIGMIAVPFLFRKSNPKIAILSYSAFVLGYTNYVGFVQRAFNFRFFWPLYLALFFGVGILTILTIASSLIKKQASKNICYIVAIIILAVLARGYAPVQGPGLMQDITWEMLQWIDSNTEKNSTVLYLYGDLYGQNTLLVNSRRQTVLVNLDDYIGKLQKGVVSRYVNASLYWDFNGGLPHGNIFSLGLYMLEDERFNRRITHDLCTFDYYTVDKTSQQNPVLAEYNKAVGSLLVKNNWIKPVYGNQLTVLLKNENPGKECMPNETKVA